MGKSRMEKARSKSVQRQRKKENVLEKSDFHNHNKARNQSYTLYRIPYYGDNNTRNERVVHKQ